MCDLWNFNQQEICIEPNRCSHPKKDQARESRRLWKKSGLMVVLSGFGHKMIAVLEMEIRDICYNEIFAEPQNNERSPFTGSPQETHGPSGQQSKACSLVY